MDKKKKNIAWWLATWFGSGMAPKAPGTFGTLAALPFAWVIETQIGNTALLIASILMFFIGIWAAKTYMVENMCEHDVGEIVIDEVAGVWFLLWYLPPTWQGYLAGFILFRFFDVLKPWPISYLDKNIHGGAGVMVDDMAAGIIPVLLLVALSGFGIHVF